LVALHIPHHFAAFSESGSVCIDGVVMFPSRWCNALVHAVLPALSSCVEALLWMAIGPLLWQLAVVQSRLPSHWDDSVVAGWCFFTRKCLIRQGVHESSAQNG
jgi:hypothetical protein